MNDDEELEKHLRRQVPLELKHLKTVGWREEDVDFDDGEVRIVLVHQNHPGVSITLMYQID